MEIQELINILHEGNYSCVIHNGTTRTFSQKGVLDLYTLLKNEPSFLEGAAVADRVVGKAAATLLMIGKVKTVYADVISRTALTLLQGEGIETNCGMAVPFIENRSKTDWCPLEKICYEEDSAEKILELIETFINAMKNSN